MPSPRSLPSFAASVASPAVIQTSFSCSRVVIASILVIMHAASGGIVFIACAAQLVGPRGVQKKARRSVEDVALKGKQEGGVDGRGEGEMGEREGGARCAP